VNARGQYHRDRSADRSEAHGATRPRDAGQASCCRSHPLSEVLEYLLGRSRRCKAASRLVLPGDNPECGEPIFEHENGALSDPHASYASASEYFLMTSTAKEATAYFDMHNGLRPARVAGKDRPVPVDYHSNDTIVEPLEDFAGGGARRGKPEVAANYARLARRHRAASARARGPPVEFTRLSSLATDG